MAQVIDQFDIPAVAALFAETDFVGMSSYPSLSPRFTPDQLENALWQFAREIKYFGVDLSKVCPLVFTRTELTCRCSNAMLVVWEAEAICSLLLMRHGTDTPQASESRVPLSCSLP